MFMKVYSEIHILVASSTLGQRQNLVKINARELLMTRGSINKLSLLFVRYRADRNLGSRMKKGSWIMKYVV